MGHSSSSEAKKDWPLKLSGTQCCTLLIARGPSSRPLGVFIHLAFFPPKSPVVRAKGPLCH